MIHYEWWLTLNVIMCENSGSISHDHPLHPDALDFAVEGKRYYQVKNSSFSLKNSVRPKKLPAFVQNDSSNSDFPVFPELPRLPWTTKAKRFQSIVRGHPGHARSDGQANSENLRVSVPASQLLIIYSSRRFSKMSATEVLCYYPKSFNVCHYSF